MKQIITLPLLLLCSGCHVMPIQDLGGTNALVFLLIFNAVLPLALSMVVALPAFFAARTSYSEARDKNPASAAAFRAFVASLLAALALTVTMSVGMFILLITTVSRSGGGLSAMEVVSLLLVVALSGVRILAISLATAGSASLGAYLGARTSQQMCGLGAALGATLGLLTSAAMCKFY